MSTARNDARTLRRAMRHASDPIADVSLVAVLLRGLVDVEGDALEALLVTLRADVDAAGRVADEAEHIGAAQLLNSIVRRLDVAVELRRRDLRARHEAPTK